MCSAVRKVGRVLDTQEPLALMGASDLVGRSLESRPGRTAAGQRESSHLSGDKTTEALLVFVASFRSHCRFQHSFPLSLLFLQKGSLRRETH